MFKLIPQYPLGSNLAPVPLHTPLHAPLLILLAFQYFPILQLHQSLSLQTRNVPGAIIVLLPRLVLAPVLLPVPLPAPLRDPLLILPVPLHPAIPVQARNIPLTRLDILLHPPKIPQTPPDIHLQARVTVQLPLNIRLQARLTVQFPPLTPLLPLNIHLQAQLTVQVHPLTPRLYHNIRRLIFLTVQKVLIVQMFLKLNGNCLSGPVSRMGFTGGSGDQGSPNSNKEIDI